MGRLGAASGLDLPVTEPALAAPPPSLGLWFFHSLVTTYRTDIRDKTAMAGAGQEQAGTWGGQVGFQVCGLLEELARGSWGWGRGRGQQNGRVRWGPGLPWPSLSSVPI